MERSKWWSYPRNDYWRQFLFVMRRLLGFEFDEADKIHMAANCKSRLFHIHHRRALIVRAHHLEWAALSKIWQVSVFDEQLCFQVLPGSTSFKARTQLQLVPWFVSRGRCRWCQFWSYVLVCGSTDAATLASVLPTKLHAHLNQGKVGNYRW